MKSNTTAIWLFALLLLSATATTEAFAQHRYIVKYRQASGVARFGHSLGSLGGSKVEELPLINGEVFSLSRVLSASELQAFYQQESQRIEYIEPDYSLVGFDRHPNDPLYSNQWGTHNTGSNNGIADIDVDLPQAWERLTGSREVVIAVLDTGIDYGHPDLRNNLWQNSGEIPGNGIDDDRNGYIDDRYGINAMNFSGDPFDDQGHGTQVAGIIGAEGNNGIGVAGVNWQTRILSVKVLDANGSGSTAGIVHGVHYAIEAKLFKGANVVAINASLGGPSYSRAMYDAIERARSAGITFVAAAGNESNDIDRTPSYPAAYNLDNVISVASVNRRGELSSFSNFGYIGTDVAAPGERVLSTYPRHLTPSGYLPYIYNNGTSFAAPYVAGIVGLLHSAAPELTYKTVQDALYRTLKTAKTHPSLRSLNGLVGLGGMVNADAALRYVLSNDLDSDGDGVIDAIEANDGTNALDRGNFNLHLNSPAFTKYNTFLNQQNYLELINVGVRPLRAEVNFFAIDGRHITSTTVLLDRSEQFHIDVNAIVQRKDTYGLIRIDFNAEQGAQLVGRLTSYRPNISGDGFAFAFTRELRNPLRGESHATSNSYDPQGRRTPVANWIELINLDELPQQFTHNIYAQNGVRVSTRELLVPALGELDVQGGHEFGQGVYLNEFIPHNPRAEYFASLARYRLNERGSDYSYAFSLDALAATGAEKYIPTFNRSGSCWSQSNWIEVVNTAAAPAPITLTFRNSSSTLLSQQAIVLPPKSQMHFNASAMLPRGTTGWAAITPWIPDSVISQGLTYYHDCRSNRLQTAFALQSTEAYQNLVQGTFNQNLGIENIVSLINPSQAQIPQGVLQMYFPGGNWRYGFSLGGLASRLGFINVNQSWAQNTYGTLEVLGSLFPPNNKLIVHNLLERPRADGGVDFVIPTAVR